MRNSHMPRENMIYHIPINHGIYLAILDIAKKHNMSEVSIFNNLLMKCRNIDYSPESNLESEIQELIHRYPISSDSAIATDIDSNSVYISVGNRSSYTLSDTLYDIELDSMHLLNALWVITNTTGDNITRNYVIDQEDRELIVKDLLNNLLSLYDFDSNEYESIHYPFFIDNYKRLLDEDLIESYTNNVTSLEETLIENLNLRIPGECHPSNIIEVNEIMNQDTNQVMYRVTVSCIYYDSKPNTSPFIRRPRYDYI